MTLPRLSEKNMISLGHTLRQGDEFVTYKDVSGYTSIIGTAGGDGPFHYAIYFSNDEVDKNGHWITDATLPNCHWDRVEKSVDWVPGNNKDPFVILHGRWMKVVVRVGETVPHELRFYLRGKTF